LFWFTGDVYYKITETYTFNADETGNIYLSLMLPTSGAYQDVLDQDIAWPGEWQHFLDGRLDIYDLRAEIQQGQPVEAVISYRVHLWQGKAEGEVIPVNSYDLLPSTNVQSDHPDIIKQAKQLLVDDSERKTAKKIFNFTIDHLEWPKESRINADTSALAAYESGIGGCEEHANLMTALCRAAEIPAHTVNGLVMPDSFPLIPITKTWDHPAGAHSWVEVLVDGTWIVADPSWSGLVYKPDLFGWTDSRHLVYDESSQFAAVYDELLTNAEDSGSVIGAMSAPMKFIAWTDLDPDSVTISPQVTVQKVWDARWFMLFSGLIIFVLLVWVISGKRKSKTQI
jgi:transglutaminase-like putative cysteine protease